MNVLSTLPALCEAKSLVNGGLPHKGPAVWSFDDFLVVGTNGYALYSRSNCMGSILDQVQQDLAFCLVFELEMELERILFHNRIKVQSILDTLETTCKFFPVYQNMIGDPSKVRIDVIETPPLIVIVIKMIKLAICTDFVTNKIDSCHITIISNDW